MQLKQALQEYIQKEGMTKLSRMSGLSDQTIWNIIRGIRPTKKTVDILYKFLRLEIDEWYISNLSSRYGESHGVGDIIKTIRIGMGKNQDEFAQLIGVNKRTLQRMENENQVPKKDTCKAISNQISAFFSQKT